MSDVADDAWFSKALDGRDDTATHMPDDVWSRASTGFLARLDRVDDALVPEDAETSIDPWSPDHSTDPHGAQPDDPYTDPTEGFYGHRDD